MNYKMKVGKQFNIMLPDGWEDQTMFMYMGPEDSGVQHILTLSVDDKSSEIDFDSYVDERRDRFIGSMQSTDILKDEEKTLPNGNPAHELVFKIVPSENNIIFRKMVFVNIKGVYYTFAANFSKKTIKTIGVEVDGIINSLVPIPE